MDPDQNRLCVGPDLCLNCLQRLSTDNKSVASKERVSCRKYVVVFFSTKFIFV